MTDLHYSKHQSNMGILTKKKAFPDTLSNLGELNDQNYHDKITMESLFLLKFLNVGFYCIITSILVH